jgi:hypothetical protein
MLVEITFLTRALSPPDDYPSVPCGRRCSEMDKCHPLPFWVSYQLLFIHFLIFSRLLTVASLRWICTTQSAELSSLSDMVLIRHQLQKEMCSFEGNKVSRSKK